MTYNYVRLVKYGSVAEPLYPSGDPRTYGPGPHDSESPPVGFTLTGWLIRPPKEGDIAVLVKTHRNGNRVEGLFWSSSIVTAKHRTFVTQNSVYCWRRVRRPKRRHPALRDPELLRILSMPPDAIPGELYRWTMLFPH